MKSQTELCHQERETQNNPFLCGWMRMIVGEKEKIARRLQLTYSFLISVNCRILSVLKRFYRFVFGMIPCGANDLDGKQYAMNCCWHTVFYAQELPFCCYTHTHTRFSRTNPIELLNSNISAAKRMAHLLSYSKLLTLSLLLIYHSLHCSNSNSKTTFQQLQFVEWWLWLSLKCSQTDNWCAPIHRTSHL